ncbi:MAG: hypothetical protein WAQ26_03235 [Candidatus Saccharimonas aalborgensis]
MKQHQHTSLTKQVITTSDPLYGDFRTATLIVSLLVNLTLFVGWLAIRLQS